MNDFEGFFRMSNIGPACLYGGNWGITGPFLKNVFSLGFGRSEIIEDKKDPFEGKNYYLEDRLTYLNPVQLDFHSAAKLKIEKELLLKACYESNYTRNFEEKIEPSFACFYSKEGSVCNGDDG